MRLLLAALLLVGCGFQPVGENGSSQRSGDQLNGGNGGPSDPGKPQEDPANGGGPTPGDPGNKPSDPGTGGDPNPKFDCKGLEDKAEYCKLNGLECPDVFKELELCYAPAPQPTTTCDVLGMLYKDCIVAHPNDPFCDQILAAYDACLAPSTPPPAGDPGTK